MNKQSIFLVVIAVLATAAPGQSSEEGELHGLIDVTFQGKYIWRGFDMFGDKSAIQPTVDLDLFGTGFGVSAMAHRANSSGFEKRERWDYMVYYYNSLFDDGPLATNYRVGWVYYNYPEWRSEEIDLQEINGIFSWPNLLPVERLVPSYVCVRMWPSRSGSLVGSKAPGSGTASGWFHIIMLDYGLPLGGLTAQSPEQVINFHGELVYNDGVGPFGQNIDQDWSHAVFGVSTDIDLGNNLTFVPGYYYQRRLERAVNPDPDENWVTLGLRYSF